MQHHQIATNGVTIHAVELGSGPAVLFCHGFPDTWRGWRRQMEAVGAAGYRALSLDMRGYGGSSAPDSAELYTPFHTVGDLIGVLDALGVSTATIVGHDFGASVAWNAAMMRPDRFTAVFGLSVPFQAHTGKSFLTGKADGLSKLLPVTEDSLRQSLPGLRGFMALDGIGHWPQLEAASAVNEALRGFLDACAGNTEDTLLTSRPIPS